MTQRSSPAPLIAALMLAEMTCSFESSMIFVAIARFYAVFGDPAKVGWLVTAFSLTAAASAAIGGRLGDLYGRRRMLLVMLIIGVAGSTVSACASDLDLMIVGRLMQGMTMAILPLAFGILRENLGEQRLATGANLLSATYSFTTGIGALIGGVIIDNFDWRGIFVLSALTGLAAITLILVVVPTSRPAKAAQPFDLHGGILFAPAIALMLNGIGSLHPGKPVALPAVEIAGGMALFGLWIRHELRCPYPLIALPLLAKREVATANLAIFLCGAGPMMTSPAVLPLLQQPSWTGAGFAMSATFAGLIKWISTISGAGAILLGSLALRRLGLRGMLIVAAGLSVSGWVGMAVGMTHIWAVALLMLFIMSTGASLTFALVPQLVMLHTPADRIGEATGVSQVVRAIGNAIGTQLVALCLASQTVRQPGGKGVFPTNGAYLLLYLAIAAITLINLGVVLTLPRRQLKPIQAKLG